MCDGEREPVSVGAAVAMLDRALDALNAADVALLPAAVQARALHALERAEAKHTAARTRVLTAFAAQGGCQDDGHGSARTWLTWQTRITKGAAVGAMAWVRRMAAHPVIAEALAAGEISASWAKAVCAWTDRLPEGSRADADRILAGAAAGGADLADLAGLAQGMYERCHPDGPSDDGFADRGVWLDVTFGGAGRLTGDLAAGCTAALSAVLEALAKKAGPEDTRTAAQRRHDALAEACRRLAASGMLPGRAGQPTTVHVHMTLAQLRGDSGASAAESAWLAGRAAQPGWLTGFAAEAAACDATVVPLVTGHVDWMALDQLTEMYLAVRAPGTAGCGGPRRTGEPGAAGDRAGAPGERTTAGEGQPAGERTTAGEGQPAGERTTAGEGETASAGTPVGGGRAAQPGEETGERATRARLRRALLGLAVEALSGPGGLAALLRGGLDGRPLTSVSLPLDIGAATETIPAHLRRAVTARHPHCAFPGCDQPASVCEVHHIIPRSRGGPTALHNLVPLCGFHHLIVVHRWGWALTLHPDGTVSATSPEGRVVHSHGPPASVA